MIAFLTTLFRLSLLGSLLAGLLCLAKPLLRGRVSRKVSYYLWLLVLLRLCLPLGLTLQLPAQAAPAPVVPDRAQTAAPVPAVPGDHPAAPTQTAAIPAPTVPTPTPAAIPPVAVTERLLVGIWATGFAMVGGWYLHGYRRLARRIRNTALPAGPEALAVLEALDPQGRVRLVESAAVSAPLLLGLCRPTVVLPKGVTDPARLGDILAHELVHVRRHDLLLKWFAAFAASVHWFNPLLPFLRREIGRACELACDEAVVQALDAPARKHYGETLLALAVQPPGLALPMAGEKRNLQERLVSIVKTYRRTPAAVLLTLAFVVALGACSLFADAAVKSGETPPPQQQQEPLGLTDPVSGTTVQLDMTREAVEALLGPGYLAGEYDSIYPNHKTDSRYTYTTEAGPIVVSYVDGIVTSLYVDTWGFLGPDTSRWATETGISCGSPLEDAVQHYQGSAVHKVFQEGTDTQLVCQGSTDFQDADSYFLSIQAKEDTGVCEIRLDRIRKATVILSSGMKNSSTGAEVSFFDSRSNVEALLGPGAEVPEYTGSVYHAAVYGEGPDALYVLYRQDTVVSFSTHPKREYGFEPIAQAGDSHWQWGKIGCGSTLAEVQQAYPGGTLMDNPQQNETAEGAVHQLYTYLGGNDYVTLSLHDGVVIGTMLDLNFSV